MPKKLFFIVTVVIPVVIAAVYYGLIASDVYISESRFVVRTQQRQESGSLLSTVLQGTSFGRAQDDAYVVSDYVLSMDALRSLDRDVQFRKRVVTPNGDIFSRFPGFGSAPGSYEDLLKYYRDNVVAVLHDSTTSITTLRTSSFDAGSAQLINERLLTMSETLVNELNQRGMRDEMQYAGQMVREAEDRVKVAALALSQYRTSQTVFDPDRQSALQLQQLGKLQDDLLNTRTRLAEVMAVSPENPQITSLRTRISVVEQQIEVASTKVTGKGSGSFAQKSREFERLSIEKQFAERQLASSLALQEQSRNEAAKKQLYIARVVQPGLPDAPQEPRRLRSILITLVMGLITWAILSLLFAGVREHTHQ